MNDRPSSVLALRLARVLGLSALAVPAAADCGGNVVVDGAATGSGGASSSSSSTQSSTGGTGGATAACLMSLGCPDPANPGPEAMACFGLPAGQACPDAASALPFFTNHGCEAVSAVLEACAGGPAGQCCYNVDATCLCVGRPLLVGGAPRVAVLDEGEDRGWAASPPGEAALDVSGLPRATREALAAAYLEDALGEHASVASFARFSLELMALGAPADLVAGAHEAALDEVRHARITFALAGAFRGSAAGPAAFPALSGVELRTDRASFARAAVIEGCVRETLAALLAAERAAAATDPSLRALLVSIAEDEARHAELGWRTVAWLLHTGGEEVAGVVFATLAEAARHVPAAKDAAADLRAFGVLDERSTRGILAAGLAEVVEPSARALRDACSFTDLVLPSHGIAHDADSQ